MREKTWHKQKVAAFTLNEMLVVLAIIGAIMLIAYPNLMPLITKAKSQEAKLNLKHIAQLQTFYYYSNSQYSLELDQIDFVHPKTVDQGGTALYRYEVLSADASGFMVQAEAVQDFDGDGILNVWQIDQEGRPTEIVKD